MALVDPPVGTILGFHPKELVCGALFFFNLFFIVIQLDVELFAEPENLEAQGQFS